MTAFDWILVVGLNGAIIVYGLFKSRETKSSTDWFLAGRSLPWWVVGFSLWDAGRDRHAYTCERIISAPITTSVAPTAIPTIHLSKSAPSPLKKSLVCCTIIPQENLFCTVTKPSGCIHRVWSASQSCDIRMKFAITSHL